MLLDEPRRKLSPARVGEILSSTGGWRINLAPTVSDPAARKQSNPPRQSMPTPPQTSKATVGRKPCKASKPTKVQEVRSARKRPTSGCGLAVRQLPDSDRARRHPVRAAKQKRTAISHQPLSWRWHSEIQAPQQQSRNPASAYSHA